MNNKIVVGMSGGVDSAMTAFLLKRDGFDPIGVNCSFFNRNDAVFTGGKVCGSAEDSEDARAVAEKIGIPFHIFDFSEEFSKYVIDNFVQTYVNGGTPNPCVECNKHLKFNRMLEKALELGADRIATGHYAITEFDEGSGRYLLKKGKDLTKDQSYVLFGLTQEQLKRTVFPLGRLTKAEVRSMAEDLGFVNAKKHDSQDICFVPDGDYAKFIERRLGRSFPCGNFVDENGRVLGEHKGIIKYTIGQHKGLGIGGLPASLYVTQKDIENNHVILAPPEKLFSKSLDAENVNLITCEEITTPLRVKAKIRYKQPEQWATVTQTDESHIHVEFDEPQRAIAKGQSVVLYDGDYVVGGGTII